MTRVPSAADWVRTLPRGARVDWDELEAHVLREHPAALRELGPAAAGVRTAGRGIRFALGAGIVAATLIAVPLLAAPLVGLAVLVGDPWGIRDVDGRFAIPFAGASLVIAGVVASVLLVRAARGARTRAGSARSRPCSACSSRSAPRSWAPGRTFPAGRRGPCSRWSSPGSALR
ncbi:hypothetical protein GCM10025870_25520 [Agromyces marinus]|uniref:DUF3040 domain-containing protein n=1 Tax=Agromyces marinus TaxID=1389020 RepID=A0ABM8H3Z3_9MICO|nr:hypothetical protein [Agromyces marinus]BDZ55479.1 hypothetical protein GCM10025870_25520 [Agromyces marinus]